MFKRMRIRNVLLFGFITVSLIAGIIGYIGIKQTIKSNEASFMLYGNVAVPLSQCSTIASLVQRLRVNASVIILLANNPEEQENKHQRFLLFNAKLDSLLNVYQTNIKNDIDRNNFQVLIVAKKGYLDLFPTFLELTKAGKQNEATLYMTGEWYKAYSKMQNATEDLINFNIKAGKSFAESNASNAKSTIYFMLIIVLSGVRSEEHTSELQ